jgi:hypothetical protein
MNWWEITMKMRFKGKTLTKPLMLCLKDRVIPLCSVISRRGISEPPLLGGSRDRQDKEVVPSGRKPFHVRNAKKERRKQSGQRRAS